MARIPSGDVWKRRSHEGLMSFIVFLFQGINKYFYDENKFLTLISNFWKFILLGKNYFGNLMLRLKKIISEI
jgi:hypothetical protein